MTAPMEYPGNLIPATAFNPGGTFTTDVEILASYKGWTQIGIDIAPGQGVLPAGVVMARRTSTKKWEVYGNGKSDGLDTARGVLRLAVNTGTDPNGAAFRGNLVVAGTLKNHRVSGADSAAIVDLGATVDTVLGRFKF